MDPNWRGNDPCSRQSYTTNYMKTQRIRPHGKVFESVQRTSSQSFLQEEIERRRFKGNGTTLHTKAARFSHRGMDEERNTCRDELHTMF